MSSRSTTQVVVSGNPARRLYDIINKVLAIPPELTVRDGWATLFQARADDWSTILSSIAETLDLIEQSKAGLLLLQELEEAKPYLDALNTTRTAFVSYDFDAKWSSISDYFRDDSAIYRELRALSIFIAQSSRVQPFTERPITKEQISNTFLRIEELIDEVVVSDFPSELKSFLVEQLEQMRRALRHYQLFGEKTLRQDLKLIAGSYVLDSRWLSHQALLTSSGVAEELKSIIFVIAALADIGQGAELVTRLLTSGN